jgi:hypothetical protein
MFAISVDGTMYMFRYSPLGLPSCNVQWIPEPAPVRTGVYLYQWDSRWVSVQWPSHLWWMRFLLVGHNHFFATRHESACHHRATSPFLAWWLKRTTIKERSRFFQKPNIPALLRYIRQHTSPLRHPWLHGHSGAIHTLRRIHNALRKHYPAVLRPCFDHVVSDDGQYSPTRSARLLKDLLQQMEQRTMVTAFLIPFGTFEQELLSRYGCLVSEAVDSKPGQLVNVPYGALGASVRRYRELGCSILDFQGDRFVALSTVEQMWNTFAGSLCRLMNHAQVVLLDAPITSRRSVHAALHHIMPGECAWVVDSAATITNVHEEIGAQANTVKHLLLGSSRCLVVDGMHRMSLRQQADVLQAAAACTSLRLVCLGGDTTGKGISRGRALDGWTLCCHAVQRGGGPTAPLDQFIKGPALLAELNALLRSPSGQMIVWRNTSTLPSAKQDIEFQQCQTVDAEVDGRRRWLCAPVSNSHLVSWVCHNIHVPRGTMLVVNWESDCRTVASHQQQQHQRDTVSIPGFVLCDQTPPFLGQDIRAVGTLRGRIHTGEVLRVVGPANAGASMVVQRVAAGGFVRLTKDELQRTCRPARLSPLHEQLNSHYARRAVLVILSHTSSNGPAMRQEWDPLYTGLGLGGARNVTIVANQSGLDAARARMMETLCCHPPDIPLIWQQFVLSLLNTGVVKKASPQ